MKTDENECDTYEVEVILLDNGDILELKEPREYSFEDLIREWEIGEPEFFDEDEWLAYKTDTHWLKVNFLEEIISLPYNETFIKLDGLLCRSRDPRSLTYSLAQELAGVKWQKHLITGEVIHARIDLLVNYLTHVKIDVRPKISLRQNFTYTCELINALYEVELRDQKFTKLEVFKMLQQWIFEFDSHKSEDNFKNTISQISKRQNKTIYLEKLTKEYRKIMEAKSNNSVN